MAQHVTLGGDRLGSGNKQKVSLHNYEMTSFNLEQDWKSTMAPGVLYPFLKLVGTNHDTFDIDLDTMIRTLPTKGPLFGSFKFQVDVFACPMRLYQGILHNNPINIGLKMNQVLLPKLKIKTTKWDATQRIGATHYNYQINESSLLKYLGLSGLGEQTSTSPGVNYVERKINAIPALAYYDIFKNYYANKQEENAYVISPGNIAEEVYYANVEECTYWSATNGIVDYIPADGIVTIDTSSLTTEEYAVLDIIQLKFEKPIDKRRILFNGLPYANYGLAIAEPENGHYGRDYEEGRGGERNIWWLQIMPDSPLIGESTNYEISTDEIPNNKKYASDIALIPFKLSNIDDMRNALLSNNTLGDEFVISKGGDNSFLPYSQLVEQFEDGISYNAFPMNGLVVKTYQSDLFNNWLDSEIIDGTGGISALSAVTVSDGKFTIDSLNLAEKVYDVLNRIAVTGGTYEDWQEAVWGEGAIRKAETPMYMGGMAAEIMFEEVISTSESNVNNKQKALGSLAGKGREAYPRGGRNIHIKCEEPTYIIGICSITPRIAYSQGNDWDLTNLRTLDDLHKPALDGIGFQDLMVEQFAWWARKYSSEDVIANPKAGKQTAWINYQTAVDKCYGEFANQDGYSFMVLNRNYEYDETDGSVKDVTTYIDPAKYNYAFTYADLDAQNFWVQLHSRIIARRKMGAQQIPNL